MASTREKIYQAIEGISFKDMGYRRDIGLFK
jgi:phosphoribosylamine-glycine ligase